ncbi:MAG TPA: nitronate monooxygenase family protein [Gemmatimonadaceae bacterium]|jgi:nitronate monooxygenase|nr:nitronate monooxygenase family protein [Gemmatimonadaceae bacterium]
MTRETRFTRQLGIDLPLICGAMYPCSNPELVAAASAAGAIGIVQPVSLTFVHGHEFRAGLRLIKNLTSRPFGMNALIEKSSRHYHERLVRWVDVALEEGVRFFITSLGNPRWVVDRAAQAAGIVYHDVTERKWANKAIDGGVHGLIAVNNVAGGHAGRLSPEALLDDLAGLGLPVICAGGVGDPATFRRMLDLGYDGVQMGTRFIATSECNAHPDYKAAIVRAEPEDIVLTERLTGVPVSVINNEYIRRLGTRSGPIARWMLRHRRTKYWMRSIYAVTSMRRLKKSSLTSAGANEYWQAGKSVAGIDSVKPVADLVREFAAALADS